MRKFNKRRILDLIYLLLWAPIGFTFGVILDLWQVWTIRVHRPKFAWVIFKDDENKLLEALYSYFPAGKGTPKEVLLFSEDQKVALTTYIGDNHINMYAPAWNRSPWRYLAIASMEWIVTFEFSETLVHISDNPSQNFVVASAMLTEKAFPDVFQRAVLTNIKLLANYVGP